MTVLALLALVVADPVLPAERTAPRYCDEETLDCAEACDDQCVGAACLSPCARSCRRQQVRCRRSVRREQHRWTRERRRRRLRSRRCALLAR